MAGRRTAVDVVEVEEKVADHGLKMKKLKIFKKKLTHQARLQSLSRRIKLLLLRLLLLDGFLRKILLLLFRHHVVGTLYTRYNMVSRIFLHAHKLKRIWRLLLLPGRTMSHLARMEEIYCIKMWESGGLKLPYGLFYVFYVSSARLGWSSSTIY